MRYLKLKTAVDNETGELGFVFPEVHQNVDGLNVCGADGMIIAHDVFEHVNGIASIGTVQDELQAMGGAWYVRGEYGDVNRANPRNTNTPHQHIGSDLSRHFILWLGGEYIYNAKNEYKKSIIKEDIKECFGEAKRIAKYEEDAWSRVKWREFRRIARSLMALGYAKAHRRYRDQSKTNSMFWLVAEAVSKAHREVEGEGQTFLLGYGDYKAVCYEQYETYY